MKTFEIFDSEDHITKEAVTGSATSLLPSGTILLVTRSGILRHTLPVAVARVPVSLNQDLKALQPHQGLLSTFVGYAIRAFGQQILHTCVKDGTTVQSVEFSDLKQFKIPIAPSNEQQRIADALDELLSDLDAGVEALRRAQAKLALYRASVLKAAVQGNLTAEWRNQHPDAEPASVLLQRILRERRQRWEQEQLRKFKAAGKTPPSNWKAKYKEPVAPDTTNLPPLPDGWCWASLDQLAEIAGGVTKGQKFSDGADTAVIPYLRVANVQRGFLDLTEIKTIRATLEDIRALTLRPNDILFNEGGDRDKLGRGWIWEGQIEHCIHQNHVFRARLCSEEIEAKLVSHCGNSYGREWFMRTGKQSVNLASINMTVLRSFPVPVMPPDEQKSLMESLDDQLSVLDHLLLDLIKRNNVAGSLRQAILRRAFTGQLVPQDPNDEPASELLKRIAAEREARKKTKATPRKQTAKRQKREK